MSGRTRLALLVEDNPEFERLLVEAIASLGTEWRSRSMRTGAEAVSALERGSLRPDLVLVDLGLPDVSGVAVIQAARRALPAARILVVSVLANSDDVLAAIRAGAHGYLQKGDSALSLAQAIERVLAGEYPLSAPLAHYLFDFVQAQAPTLTEGSPVRLSPREVELLRLFSQGYQYDEAALRMGVSLGTVQTFVRRIYEKLHVNSKLKAIATARELGWL